VNTKHTISEMLIDVVFILVPHLLPLTCHRTSLAKGLIEHLNAEIVLKTIADGMIN